MVSVAPSPMNCAAGPRSLATRDDHPGNSQPEEEAQVLPLAAEMALISESPGDPEKPVRPGARRSFQLHPFLD